MKKETTSDRLKQIMRERNLKQVDILNMVKPYCKEYGVKLEKNDLSQYISGKVEPKQKKLSVLADALNVNEVWLMGYDVPMDSMDPLDGLLCEMDIDEIDKFVRDDKNGEQCALEYVDLDNIIIKFFNKDGRRLCELDYQLQKRLFDMYFNVKKILNNNYSKANNLNIDYIMSNAPDDLQYKKSIFFRAIKNYYSTEEILNVLINHKIVTVENSNEKPLRQNDAKESLNNIIESLANDKQLAEQIHNLRVSLEKHIKEIDN